MKFKHKKNKKDKLDLNNNFFNNQNYILGRNEKKKILIKYFTESYLILFYNFFSKFYRYSLLFIILGIYVFLFISGFIFSFQFNEGWEISLIWSILMLFGFYHFYKGLFNITKNIFNVKNLKTFLIRKDKFQILTYVFNLFLISFSLFRKISDIKFLKNSGDFASNIFYVTFVPIIIFLFVTIGLSFLSFWTKAILFFILVIIFDYISLTSFLLLPLFFGLNIVMFIYSIIYTFLLKGIEGYEILKKKPQVKFLKKLKNITKNGAENAYYKINLK